VTIGVEVDADGCQKLRISVCDSGVGLLEAEKRLIFESFSRLERTAAEIGTGLGLSITKQMVETLGGCITVASPGLQQGCTFRVSLPIEELVSRSCENGKLAMSVAAAVPTVEVASGAKPDWVALIVEDSSPSARLLQRMISVATGQRSLIAGSCAHARQMLRGGAFDAVFLDQGTYP
jgi:Histidine kinase-, DNA gyrase B-, and HSP90-like ATPase